MAGSSSVECSGTSTPLLLVVVAQQDGDGVGEQHDDQQDNDGGRGGLLPLRTRSTGPGRDDDGHGREPVAEGGRVELGAPGQEARDRADQRSEEHTSELQSLMRISYAVFCLKKK